MPLGRGLGKLAVPLVAAMLLGLGGGRVSAGGPIILFYPENCATLQACIDATTSGDTILIDTDTSIDEHIVIDGKGITLQAVPGYHPSVARGARVSATAGTTSTAVIGITFGSQVYVSLTGGTGHAVTLDHVNILETTTADAISSAALEVDVTVPASVTMTRGVISNTAVDGYGINMDANNAAGLVDLRVVGVRVTAHGSSESVAGMNVLARGAGGTVLADLYNNSIWDVGRCGCGGPVGLFLLAASGAHATFNVVGNTIDTVQDTALSLSNRLQSGGVTLNAFDNVLAHTAGAAVYLDSSSSYDPASLVFHAGHNDFYANGTANHLDGHTLGSGNLHLAPTYVDRSVGNLRLRATSPLIDMGVVCPPGGEANPDAAGNTRLYGSSLDMGAFERGAGKPTGEVLVGTSGPDNLIGTGGADVLCGYGGSDYLNGHGGHDYLDGGAGNDTLYGGPGHDRLFGRGGSDLLCAADGVQGNDHLDGGPGIDDFTADPGDVRISVEQAGSCLD